MGDDLVDADSEVRRGVYSDSSARGLCKAYAGTKGRHDAKGCAWCKKEGREGEAVADMVVTDSVVPFLRRSDRAAIVASAKGGIIPILPISSSFPCNISLQSTVEEKGEKQT